MKQYNGKKMKRWLIFLIFSLLTLNICAEDTDDAIFIYYNGSMVDCYKAEEFEGLSHIASSDELTEPDILRIIANGEEYDYMLCDIDSVILTPPVSEFFWIQTKTVVKKTYLTATLRSTAGGNWKNWGLIKRGFVITTKRLPPKDEQPITINSGSFSKPGTIEYVASHKEHGLIGNKTYYYKAYAQYGKTVYGLIVPFRLEPVTIWTNTNPSVEIDEKHYGYYKTKVSADIFGETDEISEDPNAKLGFYYDKVDNPNTVIDPDRESKTAIRKEGALNEVRDIEALLDNLEPGMKYYFRPFVEIADTIYYGQSASFITGPWVTVNDSDLKDVGAASATIQYSLDVKMYQNQLKSGIVGIQYVEDSKFENADEDSYHAFGKWFPNSGSSYTSTLPKLKPNTTYFYRAYAVIDGVLYHEKNIKQFTTKDITINTYETKVFSSSTARLEGELMDKDAINEGDQYGFYISETGNPGPNNSQVFLKTFNSTDNGSFDMLISGLKPSTKYYYRAVITYLDVTYVGEEKSFTTKGEQVFYGELGIFELKGQVKSYSFLSDDGVVRNTRSFDVNGLWQTYNNTSINDIFPYGIERDEYGRIIKGFFGNNDYEEYEYDTKGRVIKYTQIYQDGGESHNLYYDNNDMLVKRSIKWLGVDALYYEDYELSFSNFIKDNHGNWTSRTVYDSGGWTYTDKRIITYYE